MTAGQSPYASRAGMKLAAALAACGRAVDGAVCCDLGSHVGGFVDCLLQHGAARVYAVEPGYGVLAYRLRRDPRVIVCERTNALSYTTPEPSDLVTIDVGWTPQRLILAAAQRCLKPGGWVLTLVKPQYEADQAVLRAGVLPPEQLEPVLAQCRADADALGWRIVQELPSPLRGHGGNVEYWFALERR